MIGRSYNGTLANGVAATGVEGLTTIVPIAAISLWYDYSRMGGIRAQHATTRRRSPTRHRPATAGDLCAPIARRAMTPPTATRTAT